MYGHGGHLGHVTSIISTNFHFHVHVPKRLHVKFGLKMAHWCLRKACFSFSYINGLGRRSRNDLDLQ